MSDVNIEVRFPITEGPRFIGGTFIEKENENSVVIGVFKGEYAYAFTRMDRGQFLRIVSTLFPEIK